MDPAGRGNHNGYGNIRILFSVYFSVRRFNTAQVQLQCACIVCSTDIIAFTRNGSQDLCKGCRTSIVEFLGGKDTVPYIKKGNEGGSVRLDVYYNQAADIAYAQLYDFCNYTYEPATVVVELNGEMVDKLISKL